MILLPIVLSILVIFWFGFYKKKRVVKENLEVVVEENLEKEAERLACVFIEEAHKNDCLSYTFGRAGDGFLSYRFEGVYKNIPISIKRGVGSITDRYLLTVEVGEHRYYYWENEASKMWKIFESLYSKIREEQKLRENERNRRQITLIKTAMGNNV